MNLLRFHRLWRRIRSRPGPEDDVTGPWEGSWHSEPTGHGGRLRCVIHHAGEGRIEAAFHAVFWKLFRATYEAELDARPIRDGYEIRGSRDLGRLFGGEFEYEGTVTPAEFRATYRSSSDHGTFTMRRPD